MSKNSKIILGVVAGVLVLCAILGVMAGIGFGYFSLRDSLLEKTVTFEPDYFRITGTLDPSIFAETARIMTERAHGLGYSRVKFFVSDKNMIVGKIPARIDTNKFVDNMVKIGLLEFVDLGSTSLPNGTIINTDLEIRYLKPSDGEQWHTIMTNREFATTMVVTDDLGRYVITFSLTDEGKRIFTQHTSDNVGKYLAIVIDKEIISCPRIESAISEGEGVIQGSFTIDEANELAIQLQSTPLPIPIKFVAEVNSNY